MKQERWKRGRGEGKRRGGEYSEVELPHTAGDPRVSYAMLLVKLVVHVVPKSFELYN